VRDVDERGSALIDARDLDSAQEELQSCAAGIIRA
jgi:hypothetical protein